MKGITKDIDYSLRALACMGASGRDKVTVAELSENLNIPLPFLRKILQALSKHGIIISHKGKGGGFSLAAKPALISILDIITIFQGPFTLTGDMIGRKICPYLETDILMDKLERVEGMVNEELSHITIETLITSYHHGRENCRISCVSGGKLLLKRAHAHSGKAI